jgi:hypothetical protein
MIRHACPNCDHEFRTADELAGMPIQCWNCHQTVEVPRPAPAGTGDGTATAVQAPPAPAATDEEVGALWALRDFFRRLKNGDVFRRQAEDPPHRGHCTLCDEPGVNVRRRYLRVSMIRHVIFFLLANRLTVQVWACDACHRKGTRLNLSRWLCLGLMLGLLLLAFFGAIPLSAQLEQSQSMTPEVARAVGLAVLIAPLAAFFLLPVGMMFWLPRRTRSLLNREADARLRELAGAERWGMFTTFYYLRRRRAGEPCDHL